MTAPDAPLDAWSGATRRRAAARGSRAEGMVFWALALLVVLMPLPFGSNRPWAWSLACLLVGLLAIAFALQRLRPAARLAPRAPSRLGVPALLLAPVLAWAVLQALPATALPFGAAWPAAPVWGQAGAALGLPLAGHVSIDPFATGTAIMRLASYAAIFALASQLARPGRRAFAALSFLTAAGAAYALYGIAALSFWPERLLWYPRWAYVGDVTSTFVNHNSYATYAGLGLLCSVALLALKIERAAGEGGRGRAQLGRVLRAIGETGWFPLLALAATLSAVLLTHSRGGFMSLAVGMAVLMVLLAARARTQASGGRRHRVGALLLVGLVLLGVLLFLGISGGRTLDRLDQTSVSGEERLRVYALVLRGIADAPWLGHGFGGFDQAFRAYQDGSVAGVFDRAHDDYLEAAFDLGIPAAILLVLTIGYLGLQGALGVFRRRRDAAYPALAAAATALVAVHSLVDFSLQMPAVSAAYAFLLGLGHAQAWSRRQDPAQPLHVDEATRDGVAIARYFHLAS